MVTTIPGLRNRLFPALSGAGPSGQVALTFDDGPDPRSTPAFLEELDRLGWQATFFVLGDMVRRAPGLTREIVAAGHEIAVHGDQHRSHARRTPRAVVADVVRAHDLVAEVTGVAPRWHRPPHGSVSAGTLLACRRTGLDLVLWTTWGRDWTASATPRSVVDNLGSRLVPGATLLLHDADITTAPEAWRSALGALPLLAEDLEARGLRVVALRDHLSDSAGQSRAGAAEPARGRRGS
jgi:peptidoglycan/xylan/chitin deacetylase (PgdA/CDA1 family)